MLPRKCFSTDKRIFTRLLCITCLTRASSPRYNEPTNQILPVLMTPVQITKDARMSLSDKISWVGGMMGLFTGFSVISGIEILYWLWFKVRLKFLKHYQD